MLHLVNNFSKCKSELKAERIQSVTPATTFSTYKALLTDFILIYSSGYCGMASNSRTWSPCLPASASDCSELLGPFCEPQSPGPSIPYSEAPVAPSPLRCAACRSGDSHRSLSPFGNAALPHACVVPRLRAGTAPGPGAGTLGNPGRACAVAVGALPPSSSESATRTIHSALLRLVAQYEGLPSGTSRTKTALVNSRCRY